MVFQLLYTSSDHEASFNNLKNLFCKEGSGDGFSLRLRRLRRAEPQYCDNNSGVLLRIYRSHLAYRGGKRVQYDLDEHKPAPAGVCDAQIGGHDEERLHADDEFRVPAVRLPRASLRSAVSFIVTFLIYLSVNEGYETGFCLPWGAVGIAVLSVFAVVFVTMMYSMRKIKKDNPIDALKNENL